MRPLLTICLFCITAFAAEASVKIHGTIKNRLEDKITFYYNTNYVAYDQQEHIAKLDDSGRFAITLNVPELYHQIMIEHGNQATELFVKDGYDLNMNLDAKDFDKTLKYSGKGSDVANFAAKHILDGDMVRNYTEKAQPLFIKEPKEFADAMKTEEKKEIDFLGKNGQQLPADFKNYWKGLYEYNTYAMLLQYPTYHEVIKKRSYDIGKVPEENYSEVVKIPAKFEDAFLSIDAYRNYLLQYYAAQYEAKGIEDVSSEDEKSYAQSDSAINASLAHMSPRSAEVYFAYKIFMGTKYTPLERTESLYAKFAKDFPDSKYRKTLEEAITMKKRLSPGNEAIDFTIVTRDGKKKKLSDLKGKVVLLDFWASWCGPCMAQMPYSKKVHEHFKGQDVEFVYISIDEDEQSWVQAIEKNQIEGMHMRENGWKAAIPKLYGIEGVPSYFLIDKKGRFAIADVPRPSDTEKLINTIENLLK